MRGMSARLYGHQGARCDSDGMVYGVQAPLQMSTAACARQGRMGRDQVAMPLIGWLRKEGPHLV